MSTFTNHLGEYGTYLPEFACIDGHCRDKKYGILRKKILNPQKYLPTGVELTTMTNDIFSRTTKQESLE
uniref:Uncharacterized protein n=1 Tax=Romanomermis culicivorax TaxID=13658 RepID=A0A915KAA1_ROMCU